MQKTPTIPPHIQAIADELVATRRGWSGPIGMLMEGEGGGGDGGGSGGGGGNGGGSGAGGGGGAGGGADAPPEAQDEQGRGLGFPKDTPTEKMTEPQRTAYWRHQSRVQEHRSKPWADLFPGKKPEEVKAAMDELAAKSLTEQEQAIEKARQEGRDEGRQAGVATSSEETAMLLLESHLEHRLPAKEDEERRKLLISSTDIRSAIGEDGKVDAARVKAIAEALAPTSGGRPGDTTSRRTDVGGGRTREQVGTGVAAGRSLFAERHGKRSAGSDDE